MRGYIPQAVLIDGFPYWLCEYTRCRWKWSVMDLTIYGSWLGRVGVPYGPRTP